MTSLTSYLVDAGLYPSTIHLSQRILRHVANLMRDDLSNILDDFKIDFDEERFTQCLLDIGQVFRWQKHLREQRRNARLNPAVEFPLTIEDSVVKIARLRDSYAVVGSDDGCGDLEMAGFDVLPGFRQVKNFALPRPVIRIALQIDAGEVAIDRTGVE